MTFCVRYEGTEPLELSGFLKRKEVLDRATVIRGVSGKGCVVVAKIFCFSVQVNVSSNSRLRNALVE